MSFVAPPRPASASAADLPMFSEIREARRERRLAAIGLATAVPVVGLTVSAITSVWLSA